MGGFPLVGHAVLVPVTAAGHKECGSAEPDIRAVSRAVAAGAHAHVVSAAESDVRKKVAVDAIVRGAVMVRAVVVETNSSFGAGGTGLRESDGGGHRGKLDRRT